MTVANDLTDRAFFAALVIDRAPIVYVPTIEARRIRDRLLVLPETPHTEQFLDAADAVVAELEQCTTQTEEQRLLTAIARGEA